MEEEYRPVVGYEDKFEVSNLGNMRRKGKEQPFRQFLHKTGYYLISTHPFGRKDKNKTFRVHREVAKAFIPNPENKPQVNHIDGNKLNNRLDNLEWVSNQENIDHAVKTGLIKRGIKSFSAKLTEDDVKFIRENYKPHDKEFGRVVLARRFNIHKSQISRIFKRITYKDII